MTQAPKRIRVICSRKESPVIDMNKPWGIEVWDKTFPSSAPHTEHFYTLEEPMTQEEPKTMNGLEALAYLNEKRGERCIENPTGFFRLRRDGVIETFRRDIWSPTVNQIGWFITSDFTACPDPSQPVDEYEKDKKVLQDTYNHPANGFSRKDFETLRFFEKWYQRKEPK